MRIIFMGTPEFAVASLKALFEAGHEIAGVITAPDKPAGRGRSLRQSAVKEYALENDLPILQPTNLKDPEFQKEVKYLQPELQVVVAFRMLPRSVWEIPKYGTINLHASLLPQYRGAAPINWAIINGETKTGLTTFFINAQIDTGELIMQAEVPIEHSDNAGTLHDKLMIRGAALLAETVKAIEEGHAPKIPQQASMDLKHAPKIFKEDTLINFEQPVETVYNFIRGLSPYPASYGILKDGDQQDAVKIYAAEISDDHSVSKAGTISTNNKNMLKVACQNGWIDVKSLQAAGKKRMSVQEFLNGRKLSEGAKFA